MNHRKTILFYISILIVVASVVDFVWLRNRIPVSLPELQQHPKTNLDFAVFITPRNSPTISRPFYGKAFLSEDEKQILSKITTDCGSKRCDRLAYRVGMICLKHRLASSEIDELFAGKVVHAEPRADTGVEHVSIKLCPPPCRPLVFEYDAKGNIVRSLYMLNGVWHYLPPLESVTPDAPIELPPLPDENNWPTDAGFALLKSKGWQRGVRVATSPPDLASLSYIDAKAAVDVILHDVGGLQFVAEYPLKIIEQLKEKNLTNDKKALAIYLLGRIMPQNTNSIVALVEQIDFKASVPYGQSEWQRLYPWSLYPARDALLQIGEASIYPIVRYLPGETNALRRQLLCGVLATFARKNWTTTWKPKSSIDQLQRLRATESEPSRQHNIDEALGLLINNKVDVNIGWSGYFGE